MHSITELSKCVHKCLHTVYLCIYVFESALLSMRGQQLVKCYQVDEKLQQIPYYNSMENKADRMEWDGEEVVSNICLIICDLRRNCTTGGCSELRHSVSFFTVHVLFSVIRTEWEDKSHRDSALVGCLNKHRRRLECCLRAQCFSVCKTKTPRSDDRGLLLAHAPLVMWQSAEWIRSLSFNDYCFLWASAAALI